eukprot:TRINITY_DN4018_c0_g1_i2.p1 TRINITY_DN4018_c0_g1~~TRINITY_DN4018_c0_g1_i2.p1  ORF type:complete len:403 (-),score=79.98 TRINITY_DN4018_c0_g1_i2:283-1491(-)
MKITFFCFQGSHFEPTLPVIQKLINAGHSLTCVIHEDIRARFDGINCKVIAYDDQPITKFAPPSVAGQGILSFPFVIVIACLEYVPKLVSILRQPDNTPDLIIFDLGAIWGYVTAKVLNIPAIHFVPSNAFQIEKPFVDKFLNDPLLEDTYKKLKEDFQVNLVNEHPWVNFSGLTIFTTTPLFVSIPLSVPKTNKVVHIGPQILPRAKDSDPLLIEQLRVESQKRKVVYMSFGSIVPIDLEIGKFLIEEFEKHPNVFLLLSVTSKEISAQLPTASNILIRNWVPQLEVFEYTHLSINHGGFNTVNEALYVNAVPMIITPVFADCFANAKAVETAGVGVQVPKEDLTKPGVLWGAVKTILDNYAFYKQNAQRIQADMKRLANSDVIANEVNNFAKEKGIIKQA